MTIAHMIQLPLLPLQGTVMEGNVPAVNMAQFKDVLKEGSIYTIQAFMLKPARDRYKTVDHQHRITITQYTKVQEVLPEPHGMPLVAHCLQPLSVLEKRARSAIVLSGQLSMISSPRSSHLLNPFIQLILTWASFTSKTIDVLGLITELTGLIPPKAQGEPRRNIQIRDIEYRPYSTFSP
jgi:hypothetical protein